MRQRALIILLVIVLVGALAFAAVASRNADQKRDEAAELQTALDDVEAEKDRLLKQTDLLGNALEKATEEAQAGGREATKLQKRLQKTRRLLARVTGQLKANLTNCTLALELAEELRSDLDQLNTLFLQALEAAAQERSGAVGRIQEAYEALARETNRSTRRYLASAGDCKTTTASPSPT